MYKITTRDGAVLYDVSYPDRYMVTEPKATLEIGQPGSLQFSLVPEHALYNTVAVMETYVRALRENNEFFYGRIIDINVDETTGLKQIECAGALNFLEDGELSPIVAEQQQSQSQGSSGQQQEQGVEMTASAFFSRVINDYNSDIGNDPKRMLLIGTINHSKYNATKRYNITSYTQAKSALESNLIGEYGGYFRVRRSGNYHYIDWLDGYNEVNTSPIRVTENVLNQENAFSANNGVITLIRPIGQNNLVLPESTVTVNQSLLNRYGRIIQTVTFGDADTVEELRTEAAAYIAKMTKGLGKTATVKVIDLHFLNNATPYIRLGATYTNISGFVGEDMIVSGMELNFADPSNDTVTLKNWNELNASQTGGATGRGTLSKTTEDATGSKGFQNIWKHISETEDSLSLHAKLISINAENLVETALQFERYSRETQDELGRITGTGVLQNNDRITQVAGSFSIKYYPVPSSKLTPETNPSAKHWYVCSPRDATEADINSGKELYASDVAAMAGDTLNTANITVGQTVWEMHFTGDTSVSSGVNYYTKGVALSQGTELTLDDEGSLITVAKDLVQRQDDIDHITGSALWTQQEHIVGVCGDFSIHTDDEGRQYLRIDSGGGIKIFRDNTEFGLYDQDNLTGGILVSKINDPNNQNAISGTKVDIVASQVRVSNTQNVAQWMTETGGNISTLSGLITDTAYIAQLNAQTIDVLSGKIHDIEADYITSEDLSAADIRVTNIYALGVDCETVDCMEVNCAEINGYEPRNFLADAVVDESTNTLTIYRADNTVAATFKKAASVTLDGVWSGSGATYTVTAYADGVEKGHKSTTISLNMTGSGNIIGAQVKNEANRVLLSSGAKLEEDVQNKQVTCTLTGGSLSQIAQISTRNTYTTGYNSGNPSSGRVSGQQGGVTSPIYGILITRADGSTYSQPIYVDCTSIYRDARKGYTYGTFNRATVSLSGSKTSNMIVKVKSTASVRINTDLSTLYTEGDLKHDRGTTKIRVGSAAFLYPGDGGEFIAQPANPAIQVRYYADTKLYTKSQAGNYYLAGEGKWYRGDMGSWYYAAGTETKHDRGEGFSAYKKLATGGTVYYKGDGGEFHAVGNEVSAYIHPDSGGTWYYQADTDNAQYYWNEPTTNSTDYYTKS